MCNVRICVHTRTLKEMNNSVWLNDRLTSVLKYVVAGSPAGPSSLFRDPFLLLALSPACSWFALSNGNHYLVLLMVLLCC